MSVKNKRDEICCSEYGCTNNCCPAPKRATTLHYDETTTAVTILDILDIEVCRRAMLDYLPVAEILRSECVCSRWRDAIHQYIRGARRARRRLHITAPWHHTGHTHGVSLPLDETRDTWFSRTIFKWGMSIEAAPCTVESFASIAELCPNLQELTFYGLPDQDLVRQNLDKFGNLKRIAFRNLCSPTGSNEKRPDEVIATFLQKATIEELTIVGNEFLTGSCLNDLKANLTSFCFQDCPALDHNNLLPALSHLKELKTLELTRNPIEILQNVHLLLSNMPKLERLNLCWYNKVDIGDEFLQVLGRLRNLKHLSLRHNASVSDKWLQALIRVAKLESLDVSYCKGVTLDGMLTACRAFGATLTTLGMAQNDCLTDEDIETIIRICPHLMLLDIEECRGLTPELVNYLARLLRRRRRWHLPELRLRLRGTAVPDSTLMVRDLSLDFGRPSQLSAGPDAAREETPGWYMDIPTDVFLSENQT